MEEAQEDGKDVDEWVMSLSARSRNVLLTANLFDRASVEKAASMDGGAFLWKCPNAGIGAVSEICAALKIPVPPRVPAKGKSKAGYLGPQFDE